MWSDCEYCGHHDALPIAFSKRWKEIRKMYQDVKGYHHSCNDCVLKMLRREIDPRGEVN